MGRPVLSLVSKIFSPIFFDFWMILLNFFRFGMSSHDFEYSWSSPSKNSSKLGPLKLRTKVILKLKTCSAFILGTITSILTFEDLSFVQSRYVVPPEYELELPGSDEKIYSPPPGRLGLYTGSTCRDLIVNLYLCT